MEEQHFSWYQLVPSLANLPYHVVAAFTVVIFLMVLTGFGRLALAGSKDVLVPHAKLSFFNFFDLVAEGLYKLTESILGEAAGEYYPLIGTLFMYIFVSNLMGLIPGFSPPTGNVNTNFACSIFVFVYYNYVGFKHAGIGYIKHFMGPVWYLAWVILPIEIISHVVRPFTLSLRLMGNMTGDHTVIAAFTHLVPYGIPVAFYFLGLLVCFIQAFVYTMLTMVYISMARESDHH
jgi:F-type H+-transporting ATPase subunit a